MVNGRATGSDLYELDTIGHAEGLNRQHVTAGTIACALSLGIHAVMLFSVARMDFGFFASVSRGLKEQREYHSIALRDVMFDEAIPDMASANETPREGVGITTDLSREIEILRKAPDAAALQPARSTDHHLTGEGGAIAEPSAVPKRAKWVPHQEIVAIRREVVRDEITGYERRRIPRVERVSEAPDYVPDVNWEDMLRADQATRGGGNALPQPGQVDIAGEAAAKSTGSTKAGVVIDEPAAETGAQLFPETAGDVTSFKPVETLLQAQLWTYGSRRDPDFGYFRVDLQREGEEVLPVVPKDIILVQDCSASMAEQRLYFCREGLRRCLAKVGPEDRFNVIGFRESGERCFPEWGKASLENILKAETFIDGMRSGGNTDIYASIAEVLSFKREAGRPVVVLVITDGLSTVGVTRSSDIIAQFSKLNDGGVSVFAMGTIQKANGYLLDLLSYSNRGGSQVVTSGRWDIPTALETLMAEVSRPVLSDVAFRFAADSECESYPKLTENLYLDRPLVIYGRYPHDAERITFQAVGQAGEVVCDMVFDLKPAADGRNGDEDIRTTWAKQKIYHLIAQYARRPDAVTMQQIRQTASDYKVKIPHMGAF